MDITARHQGVSVTVTLTEPLDVTERWGNRACIAIDQMRAVFHTLPSSPADVGGMTGQGYAYKKDGTLGLTRRTNVSVYASDIPDPVRQAVFKAAHDEWLLGGRSS